MKYALGIIETVGLAAAIQAADTAVKSANVKLIGYELTKGDGMAMVKIEGDVGAVKAAIESAKASATLVNKVFGFQVIPRPSDGLEVLVRNDETVGYYSSQTDKADDSVEPEKEVGICEVVESLETADELETIETAETMENSETTKTAQTVEAEEIIGVTDFSDSSDLSEIEAIKKKIISSEPLKKETKEICNICRDPNCTRKKGDQRRRCIHYFDKRKGV